MAEIFIGIDLGGTNIAIGCFDDRLTAICKTRIPCRPDLTATDIAEKIGGAVEKLLAENSLSMDMVCSAGIGVPGPSNIAEGTVIAAPNLPLLKNAPIRDMLSSRLSRPVAFENDANAACWAEYVIGAGRDIKDMVFFTLGTGIGAGIISGGKIVHGFADSAAELGHIIIYPDGRTCNCGQRGCAEAYASAASTARCAVEAVIAGEESSLKKILAEKKQITCEDVYGHAAAGDRLAVRITEQTAKVLGLLCVNALHFSEPEKIVFAGGMIAAGRILLDRIKYYFNENIWSLKKEPVEICFAALGEDAGIIGAAALAKQQRPA